jgi:hypothetical protein
LAERLAWSDLIERAVSAKPSAGLSLLAVRSNSAGLKPEHVGNGTDCPVDAPSIS